MDIPKYPVLIDQHLCRQPAQLEQPDFLPIPLQHDMLWIGQAGERQVVFLPVITERIGALGADDNDSSILGLETIMVLTQLRHVLSAKRSDESPVEHGHHMFLAPHVRKGKVVSFKILQGEIWGKCIQLDFCHNQNLI